MTNEFWYALIIANIYFATSDIKLNSVFGWVWFVFALLCSVIK